ncbi:MAG: MaoC domain protein dehydratase [Labilithrix sp.]|nr:MaoC domain protein dehydratase [Labilithrix sp.]
MNEYRWADLTLGLRARFEADITDASMAAFAEMSGDVNPLHTDDAFAVARGFPGRVAFGMLASSFYSTLVGIHLPGKYALLHGIDIEMKSPAFVGDRLTVSGEIVHLTDAYQRLEIKASIVNANGKTISKAKIRAGVHEP